MFYYNFVLVYFAIRHAHFPIWMVNFLKMNTVFPSFLLKSIAFYSTLNTENTY